MKRFIYPRLAAAELDVAKLRTEELELRCELERCRSERMSLLVVVEADVAEMVAAGVVAAAAASLLLLIRMARKAASSQVRLACQRCLQW